MLDGGSVKGGRVCVCGDVRTSRAIGRRRAVWRGEARQIAGSGIERDGGNLAKGVRRGATAWCGAHGALRYGTEPGGAVRTLIEISVTSKATTEVNLLYNIEYLSAGVVSICSARKEASEKVIGPV